MPSDQDRVRIGTAEREDAIRVLGEHLGAGRLTVDEYDERVSKVVAAQTRADVQPLFDDLPAPRPTFLLPPLAAMPPPAAPASHPYGQAPVAPPNAYVGNAQYELSDKSRLISGVLQIILPFGIGRFYTGHTGMAIAQLLVTLFTFGAGAIWCIIDGIFLLANGGKDPYGRRLRD